MILGSNSRDTYLYVECVHSACRFDTTMGFRYTRIRMMAHCIEMHFVFLFLFLFFFQQVLHYLFLRCKTLS